MRERLSDFLFVWAMQVKYGAKRLLAVFRAPEPIRRCMSPSHKRRPFLTFTGELAREEHYRELARAAREFEQEILRERVK